MLISSEQLADELRGVARGIPWAGTLTRGLYATDASPFHLLPDVVIAPLDEDDLVAILKYAHERGVPVVPRGAGTGLAGESLGSGIVLDLSKHFRNILAIENDTVTVEPGITLRELNVELAKSGRRFAPDPASGGSCTIGGMIATNASGGTAFLHGYTRDHIAELRGVGDDGRIFHTPDGIDTERLMALQTLLHENRELIESNLPRTRFNRCGYLLHDLLKKNHHETFDSNVDRGNFENLSKLFVGSEGTLGIITRATLRTIPRAGGVVQFLLGYATLETALHAGPMLRRIPGMAGCDLLDQRLIASAKVALSKISLTSASVGAVLIGTVEAETERDALVIGQEAFEAARAIGVHVVLQEPTCEPSDIARIQLFRESAVSGLYSLGRGRRPEAFIEDVAVPDDGLPEFIAKMRDLLRGEEINASFLIHLLASQVHTRPLLDVNNPADREKMWPLADRVYSLVRDLGGTISTQHGVGLARTPWVEKQYGPLMPVFRELKRIFDPKSILNPGKIIGPDPSRPAWPMMALPQPWTESPRTEPTRQPLLIWKESSPIEEASKCNGCGDCRPRSGPERMCPIFRASGDEAATPRAKANLVKLLDNAIKPDVEELAEIARHCVNCKMCRKECPAEVDIPKLMLEAKAAHYAEHGFRRHEWLLARSESLVRFAGQFSWTMNTLLNWRPSRWFFEKFFGLSRHALLPRFTHRTFLRRAWWMGITRRGGVRTNAKKVAYFVDTFANYCDPSIGEAAVAVLKHHGCDVHVPRRQRGSGITSLSFGDSDGAREVARYNVRSLAELVRDGYTIVCTEPSAVVALTHDYLALLDDADAKLVAANTVEMMTFLSQMHDRGELKAPTVELPIGIGHHVPCHIKAMGRPAAPTVLANVPGMHLETIDIGCSGMAGTWGLAQRHRATSLAAGAELHAAFDRPRYLFGSTECSACRMRMLETTGKRTLHPVQWLAMAYGLIDFLPDRP